MAADSNGIVEQIVLPKAELLKQVELVGQRKQETLERLEEIQKMRDEYSIRYQQLVGYEMCLNQQLKSFEEPAIEEEESHGQGDPAEPVEGTVERVGTTGE